MARVRWRGHALRVQVASGEFWPMLLTPEFQRFSSETERRQKFAALVADLEMEGAADLAERIRKFLKEYPTQAGALAAGSLREKERPNATFEF